MVQPCGRIRLIGEVNFHPRRSPSPHHYAARWGWGWWGKEGEGEGEGERERVCVGVLRVFATPAPPSATLSELCGTYAKKAQCVGIPPTPPPLDFHSQPPPPTPPPPPLHPLNFRPFMGPFNNEWHPRDAKLTRPFTIIYSLHCTSAK